MTVTPTRTPQIVHHMAALDGVYPPNSLEAIKACLDSAAEVVEIDISALADSDYLLVHDLVLETETTGQGGIQHCSAMEARTLHFRDRHTGSPTPYRVPLLSDVVGLFQEHSSDVTRLQLDFKSVFPFSSDEPIQRLVNLIMPLKDRVIVSSGADWQLRRMRHYAGWLNLGFDIHFYLDWCTEPEKVDSRLPPYRKGSYGFWDDHPLAQDHTWTTADYLADRCASLIGLVSNVSTFYISHSLLIQSLNERFNWAEALHRQGIKLDAWTLDVGDTISEANAQRLVATGVDYLTTNTPREMKQLVDTIKSVS
jgi:glycerophosphoryl diester phosphodiesterase